MAANHPSLLMRAMQIENAISPHEADDPDLEKRLPDLQVGNGLTKKKISIISIHFGMNSLPINYHINL